MPTARESLLQAAEAALAARPWPAVRMVEVAAAAGVSRQTLYNEFGGKAGLGRALVRRAADWYLDGVERALAAPAARTAAERLAAVAEWTVRAARARSLVRALLTGSWGPALPAPPPPGSRQAIGPGELTRAVRDRAAAALPYEPVRRCELAVRLALSYVVAPGEDPGREPAAELLRLLSAPSRTAGGR
ncbi:TetR/AcrR family transcriptional regulator [Streptomyces sp. NBC_00091]|uniref:TetR/AcrR family transcriptional regulator n=1 Tax=Streptomyces sp. NBC_00091 TaxID=2975648 RepID=UPI002258BA04|nr:TetR/AcrR family transcriptional regulator [Streptomyces sp. NBC_00091]MCX5375980.1 TetR/AcrR family transcriptional regulator [Streptomyces sp. NBC_00091]